MVTKSTFERIAADLREAKVLGLFMNSAAHSIVVANIANALETTNRLFDTERFSVASGVQMVDHSKDEPVRPLCSNKIAEADDSPDAHLDDMEIDGPDCD